MGTRWVTNSDCYIKIMSWICILTRPVAMNAWYCCRESPYYKAIQLERRIFEWTAWSTAYFEGVLWSRPPSLEQSKRWGVIPVNSPVDSMFEQSENITIAHFLVVTLSSCCWHAMRGVACTILCSAFICTCMHTCTSYNGQSCTQSRYCLWACTVNRWSCILATLSHDCVIKHTHGVHNSHTLPIIRPLQIA